MTFALRCVALLSSLLALSACKSFNKEEPPPCPHVSILADSASLTRFAAGAAQDDKGVVLKAELTSFHGSCSYDADEHRMNFDLDIGIDANRGAAMTGSHADIAYYVAVPAFYPAPFGKEVFPLALNFDEGRDHLHVTDQTLHIAIPMVADAKEMNKYEVFLGLQLTPAELSYNRQKRDHR
jgi:hypothetical protein